MEKLPGHQLAKGVKRLQLISIAAVGDREAARMLGGASVVKVYSSVIQGLNGPVVVAVVLPGGARGVINGVSMEPLKLLHHGRGNVPIFVEDMPAKALIAARSCLQRRCSHLDAVQVSCGEL